MNPHRVALVGNSAASTFIERFEPGASLLGAGRRIQELLGRSEIIKNLQRTYFRFKHPELKGYVTQICRGHLVWFEQATRAAIVTRLAGAGRYEVLTIFKFPSDFEMKREMGLPQKREDLPALIAPFEPRKMITLRVPAPMIAATRQAAAKDGHSMNQWCAVKIAEAIRAQGLSLPETPAKPEEPAKPAQVKPADPICSICRNPTPRKKYMVTRRRCLDCDRKLFLRQKQQMTGPMGTLRPLVMS